ncbi:MAG TPA: GAF domain-containing protein [Candidatus Deferrimicrobium sp.]|nr:GAF domain-containing protein [Candidatus Deferrimicrobium sp.]
MTIDATERDRCAGVGLAGGPGGWPAVAAWARDLAARIADEQPAQHIAVFVPDDDGFGLRLAAQVWGAGEDTGAVVVGVWSVPFEGSVCGRVYRTGLAALCADVGLDPDYRPFPGGRTRSSLTVPVGPPADVVAVINLEAPWVAAFSIRDYERMTDRAATAFASFPGRQGD